MALLGAALSGGETKEYWALVLHISTTLPILKEIPHEVTLLKTFKRTGLEITTFNGVVATTLSQGGSQVPPVPHSLETTPI